MGMLCAFRNLMRGGSKEPVEGCGKAEKVKISACFCQIPVEKLVSLVRMRFVEGIPTQELMKKMESKKDREYLATVSLLDVRKDLLLQVVEAEDHSLLGHLLSCRERAKEILAAQQIRVKEREAS